MMFPYRCSECTLYRCRGPASACDECLKVMVQKMFIDVDSPIAGIDPLGAAGAIFGGKTSYSLGTVTMLPTGAIGAAAPPNYGLPLKTPQPAPSPALNGTVPIPGLLSRQTAVEAALKLMHVSWADISLYMASHPLWATKGFMWDEVYRALMDYGNSP